MTNAEDAERDAFRASVRRFVEREIEPCAAAWDEAETFPRELYGRAAAAGLLGSDYPEALGGTPAGMAWRLIATEEVARAGSGGLMASLFSHAIGLPPIVAHGSEARTGGPGAGGISLLAVPGAAPGLERTPLAKMGWWCSDTAQLRFANGRVPLDHLIGTENDGFRAVMDNFDGERLLLGAGAAAFAGVCFDAALAWARQRRTFGQALVEHQVVRHKLMDMRLRVFSSRAWVEALVARHDRGETGPEWVAELCLLKNHATQAMHFCADQAVQILGGTGFVRGTKSERIYREVKVMMIGGGAEEIMKELAARQLGV